MIVEAGGVSLWEPSLRVGELFLAQVAALERTVGKPGGVTTRVADEIEIDLVQFRAFLEGLLDLVGTSRSRWLAALVSGPAKVGIVLYEKGTGERFEIPPEAAEILAGVSGMNMPPL
jgi:hypothetical protein